MYEYLESHFHIMRVLVLFGFWMSIYRLVDTLSMNMHPYMNDFLLHTQDSDLSGNTVDDEDLTEKCGRQHLIVQVKHCRYRRAACDMYM